MNTEEELALQNKGKGLGRGRGSAEAGSTFLKEQKETSVWRAKGVLYRHQRDGKRVLCAPRGLAFILSARGSLQGFQKEQNKILFACLFVCFSLCFETRSLIVHIGLEFPM